MLDLQAQREYFKDHVATLHDYGCITVLDFKNPDSNECRIRFIFENDHCQLHISGDLGTLTAANYDNMTINHFYRHFANNPNYFYGKIVSHQRDIYTWNEERAKEDLYRRLTEDLCIEENDEDVSHEVDDAIDRILYDFSNRCGINTQSEYVRACLDEVDHDWWEWVDGIGKEKTGIVELYLLAFRLAWKQLHKAESNRFMD